MSKSGGAKERRDARREATSPLVDPGKKLEPPKLVPIDELEASIDDTLKNRETHIANVIREWMSRTVIPTMNDPASWINDEGHRLKWVTLPVGRLRDSLAELPFAKFLQQLNAETHAAGHALHFSWPEHGCDNVLCGRTDAKK